MKSGIKCARTACESMNATCRHTQSGREYCHKCAIAINSYNPGLVTIPPQPNPRGTELAAALTKQRTMT